MNPRRDSENDIRYLDVHNASGEAIPAFSVVMVTGDVTEDGLIEVDQPDEVSLPPAKLMFTGPSEIPADGEGAATRDWPARCTCDALSGDSYGTAADSWELVSGNSGFQAWGTASEDDGSQLFVAEGGGSASDGAIMTRVASGTPVTITLPVGTATAYDAEKIVYGSTAQVWLVQVFGHSLSFNGNYIAVPYGVSGTNAGDTRKVYLTSEFPAKDTDCNDVN